MHSVPPKIVERIVGALLPPACREEVLGDLYERCTSTGQYILEAFFVVPMVILSRVRRTADSQVLFMQAFVLYLSYLGTAWYLERAFLHEDRAFLKLAAAPALIMFALLLDDAYAKPGKRSSLQTVRGVILGLGFAYTLQAVLASVPPRIMLVGSAVSLLSASALRILFPPVTDRPVGAGGPAFWLKHAGGSSGMARGAASAALQSLGVIVAIVLFGEWIGGPSLMRSLIWLSAIILLIREFSKRA